MLVSICCKKPIYVEGSTTMYYVCSQCGMACDPMCDMDVTTLKGEPNDFDRTGS